MQLFYCFLFFFNKRQNLTSQNEKTYAKYHAIRGTAFMKTSQYQRAFYDFSAAIKFDDSNATYYGFIFN